MKTRMYKHCNKLAFSLLFILWIIKAT